MPGLITGRTSRLFVVVPVLLLLAFTAINQRDYGIIQGVVLFVALGFILVNLVVDVIYVYVDPRIRY